MINKLIKWFNRNACKECNYYCLKNNVCQSKKCVTCGCHPYVNWFDRYFCKPYKAESEEEIMEKEMTYSEAKNYLLHCIDEAKSKDWADGIKFALIIIEKAIESEEEE